MLPLMSLVFDVVSGSPPDAVETPELPVAGVPAEVAIWDGVETLVAGAETVATLAAAGVGVA